MKNFQKFLEEATLKGNPGVPGEGGKKRGESDYLSDVERRAKTRLGVGRSERELGGQANQLGRRLMTELVPKSMEKVTGHETELEELAHDLIMGIYGSILDGVKLDIKIIRPGAVKDFMEEEEEEEPDMPNMREIKDPEIIREIHKRKIANNIMQGESKNTKHILHLEEAIEGINKIYGETEGKKIHAIWDEITKTADKLDWIIPALEGDEAKGAMMEEHPEGLAGAVKVDWKPKEKKEKEEEEEKEPDIDKIINGGDEEEELHEDFEPVIKARGIDFPMLLHETVKGIYELIAAVGIPEDEEVAKKVLANTSSMADESEEFRFGPEIASDLRDFVSVNKKVDEFPNIREFVFGKMMKMPAQEFLDFMRSILSKTPEARKKIDSLVDEIIEEIKEGHGKIEEWEGKKKDEEDYKKYASEHEEGDVMEPGEEGKGNSEEDELIKQSREINKEPEVNKKDMSTWSQRDLEDEMDLMLDMLADAKDEARKDKIKKRMSRIQSFMEGASKVVYQRELEIINEGKNPHTK